MELLLMAAMVVGGGVGLADATCEMEASSLEAPLRCEDFGKQMDECLMASIRCEVDDEGNCVTPKAAPQPVD